LRFSNISRDVNHEVGGSLWVQRTVRLAPLLDTLNMHDNDDSNSERCMCIERFENNTAHVLIIDFQTVRFIQIEIVSYLICQQRAGKNTVGLHTSRIGPDVAKS